MLLRSMRSVRTWPVWTFRAAMIETVPWRTYSNSRRAPPGASGLVGVFAERAVIPVFSSTLITTAFGGQVR